MKATARRPALGANFLVLACATWWCPAAGFFPGLALRLPPLLSSEVREKLCAGWTEVQVATHSIRAEWSEMHQQYRDKLDEVRGSDAYGYASVLDSGTIYYPDERQYYHTDKPIRASLEVLAALPDAGHAELDECVRETEAAKSITHRLWEEGHQLEDQGKLQAAEEKFERADRAEEAWMRGKLYELDALVKYLYEIGATEEAYTWMREATAQFELLKQCEELEAQGEDEARDEILERVVRDEEQRITRMIEMAESGSFLEDYYRSLKDEESDAGFERGTTARLERAFLAAPAVAAAKQHRALTRRERRRQARSNPM